MKDSKVSFDEFRLEVEDNFFLHYLFLAARKDHPGPSDLILFIQGRNESSAMYEHVLEHFRRSTAYALCTYDVRGQGKSSGRRGHLDSFGDHLEDLKKLIQFLRSGSEEGINGIKGINGMKGNKKIHEITNIHLVGHSTGALLAGLFALDFPDLLGKKARVVWASPFLGLPSRGLLGQGMGMLLDTLLRTSLWNSRLLGPILDPLKKWALPGPTVNVKETGNFAGNDLTIDEEFFGRFHGHPEKCGPPTLGWILEVSKAQRRLLSRRHEVTATFPLMILLAGEDKVVNNELTEGFRPMAEIHVYQGQRHVLFWAPERVRTEVWGRIKFFIEGSR